MVGVKESIAPYLPNFGGSGTFFTNLIQFVLIIGVVVVVGGALAYMVITKTLWNKRIVLFKKVGQRIEPAANYKAREMMIGEVGDMIFFVRKLKKRLPRPEIQTGKNTYWYYERVDGEWINFGLDDIDELMRKAGAQFLDKEVRYARLGIGKSIDKRYEKVTFWDKFGTAIMGAVAVFIILLGMAFVFNQWQDVAKENKEAIAIGKEVMAEARGAIVALDNLRSSGGVQPVPEPPA